jgi:hypothetical protein
MTNEGHLAALRPEVAMPERGHELFFGAFAATVLNRALRPLL